MEQIKIKYFSNEIDKISKMEIGDWIDLRAAEDVELAEGEFKLINLGVGMILPKGYEAHVVPRSSTYKNFGIIQTNHMGVIDESYCGDNDQWKFPAKAERNTVIHKNDRICQFRIVKKQPELEFVGLGNGVNVVCLLPQLGADDHKGQIQHQESDQLIESGHELQVDLADHHQQSQHFHHDSQHPQHHSADAQALGVANGGSLFHFSFLLFGGGSLLTAVSGDILLGLLFCHIGFLHFKHGL